MNKVGSLVLNWLLLHSVDGLSLNSEIGKNKELLFDTFDLLIGGSHGRQIKKVMQAKGS